MLVDGGDRDVEGLAVACAVLLSALWGFSKIALVRYRLEQLEPLR
jgi:hypothetical protein